MSLKNQELVEELVKLSPDELNTVLVTLEQRLIKDNQISIAKEIIEKYRPALLELAK